jgi:hypothetical protein
MNIEIDANHGDVNRDTALHMAALISVEASAGQLLLENGAVWSWIRWYDCADEALCVGAGCTDNAVATQVSRPGERRNLLRE